MDDDWRRVGAVARVVLEKIISNRSDDARPGPDIGVRVRTACACEHESLADVAPPVEVESAHQQEPAT